MKYGVPVAISTDDEGVSRSNMTHEYLRAIEGYGLTYVELKRIVRQSLEHSFLPGKSLWKQTSPTFVRVGECDSGSFEKPSYTCVGEFLAVNERAAKQYELEKAFAEFESKF
jgi:hypothetical protein